MWLVPRATFQDTLPEWNLICVILFSPILTELSFLPRSVNWVPVFSGTKLLCVGLGFSTMEVRLSQIPSQTPPPRNWIFAPNMTSCNGMYCNGDKSTRSQVPSALRAFGTGEARSRLQRSLCIASRLVASLIGSLRLASAKYYKTKEKCRLQAI